MERLISIFGIFVFCLLAYFASTDKRAIRFSFIGKALLLQVLLAVLLLGIPNLGLPGILNFLFKAASHFFSLIISFADQGSSFVAGPLSNVEKAGGFIFAVKVLPIVIFFSSFMAVLYHWGIMQKIVGSIAYVLKKVLPISAAEALASSANIFLGQTEAPLVIRPYVAKMTKSELHCLMVGGMATVAGSVLAAFVDLLSPFVEDIGGHLLTASVLSAPAAILFAKILVPENEKMNTESKLVDESEKHSNAIEAIAEGASTGMKMAINILAMLISFIAIIALLNHCLASLGEWIQFQTWGEYLLPKSLWEYSQGKLSFEVLLSLIFMPIAFLLGIPLHECAIAGSLLGEKIVLNEFYAYIHLAQLGESLSPKSILILSYALCGFANFSSIGIQIGGIGELAPKRKADLAKLGLRAMLGGSLAAFTTACIANILL